MGRGADMEKLNIKELEEKATKVKEDAYKLKKKNLHLDIANRVEIAIMKGDDCILISNDETKMINEFKIAKYKFYEDFEIDPDAFVTWLQFRNFKKKMPLEAKLLYLLLFTSVSVVYLALYYLT